MTRLCLVLSFAIAAALVLPAAAQAPDEFELYQNDPNPFCNTPGGGATVFAFFCPEDAFVTLQVLSQDTTSVVADLVNENKLAGSHSILWDGTDDSGIPLALGSYPYVMTAIVGRPPVFDFADTLIATIECSVVPVREISWGRIKAGYLETEPVGDSTAR